MSTTTGTATAAAADSTAASPAATRPLLGVIACNRAVGGEIAASVMQRYLVAAATHMQASLVIVPSLPAHVDAQRLASMLDGLLLTGSPSNVAPRRYGAGDAADSGVLDEALDEDRDEVAQRLLAALTAAGKPVFGICRGLQEINVALGGTLARALAGHHAPPEATLEQMFGFGHEVTLTPGGRLERALGQRALRVNSVHFQGIDRLAPGLAIEARSADGVIEAVSGRIGDAQLLAVQWHPEWRADDDASSRGLLRYFGSVLRGQA